MRVEQKVQSLLLQRAIEETAINRDYALQRAEPTLGRGGERNQPGNRLLAARDDDLLACLDLSEEL